uniref:Pentatricopeptide repeat-containing protein n=1 Tax=Rhizophora mucronata TaxID=61149 RepID=A0A2P2IM16_RHIMU
MNIHANCSFYVIRISSLPLSLSHFPSSILKSYFSITETIRFLGSAYGVSQVKHCAPRDASFQSQKRIWRLA